MDEIENLKQENQRLRQELEKLKNQRGQNQKSGMINKASSGKVMSKPAFGYKIEQGKLVKDEEKARKIHNLFQDFLQNNISLNQLANKYGFSVNGVKKILKNFTYLGKIKFDNQIHEGQHEAIISSTDFNHVQDKLDEILNKN
jgi:site-specific DNA recombinase